MLTALGCSTSVLGVLMASSVAMADDVVRAVAIVADTSTPIPGGGTFAAFSGATMNSYVVAFRGVGQNGPPGLYRRDLKTMTLERIADTGTSIPDGTSTFSDFSRPAICDSPDGAFMGSGPGGQQGLYLFTGPDVVELIVDRGDPIPGTEAVFDQFSMVSHDASPYLAFRAIDDQGVPGIFTTLGGVRRVVDPNTSFVHGGIFSNFGEGVTISGSRLVFRAEYDETGSGVIVADISVRLTTLDVIADTGMDAPESASHVFTNFGDRPSVSGNFVTFVAETEDNKTGIYLHDGTSFTVVANENMAIPDGSGNFKSFGDMTAASGPGTNPFGRVVFLGEGSSGQVGLYARINDVVYAIVDDSTVLDDGRRIVDIAFDPAGISRSQVAFTTVFDDGSLAVMCADLRRVGDATGDDVVDIQDMLVLLATWGPCTDSPADFNGDTDVDIEDLLALLGAWD